MIQPIRIEGDPCLVKQCKHVDLNCSIIKEVLNDMHETLNATATGVGLSAPQLGWLKRIFILGGNTGKISKINFINPVIIELKGSKKRFKEGCLSVPGIFGYVERFQKVRMTWYDENLKQQEQLFKGFEAVVIQHEFDHLEGISFHQRMTKTELKKIQFDLKMLRQGKFDKVPYAIQLHESHVPEVDLEDGSQSFDKYHTNFLKQL